ncbi:amidohydrolase family protein [Cyanobium sp. LEGE 06143]|uniref:amidohydrolase family protein n=1 Tax=Cyanobium sp. LEGE 06143 TaxID=945727 RepID=UPI001882AD1C|nr:amidohydrolase family protein [Cyanobium sp. LEGE 06143]MBE9172759.1 amidohydrolase family protein [Cyanobium sp. LEGE 06143]
MSAHPPGATPASALGSRAGRLELRLPRALLEARQSDLAPVDAEGLVAVELSWQEGRITGLRPLGPEAAAESLPLALPPLVEPHAHLDKAFSAPRFPNWEGTMAGALAQNQREYGERSEAQVLERAERALQLAWRQGVRALRSHVDSVGPGAVASWEALLEIRRRWAGRVELQLVALTPLLHWLTPQGEELARWVAERGGLLGGVLGPPYGASLSDREALAALLALAERHGAAVDLHVDEADTQPARGVELVVRLALEQRCEVPIVCSHAASLALLSDRRADRLAERLAQAGIGVVALPLTNLWLLGRRPGRTPDRRVQAPIATLQRAGVRVAIGADNVQDPWFPGGDFDPIELLRLAAITSHVVPSRRQGLAPFSTAAAALLGLEWDGVLRTGAPADLVVLAARSWGELLARSPQRRVLRAGVWLEPPPMEQPSPLLRAVGPTPRQ